MKSWLLLTWLTIACPIASAQTVITVNAGQTLSEIDLNSGVFEGTTFALDSTTTFEINDGGVIGPAAETSNFGDPNSAPYDFGGANINVNKGGLFASDPFFGSSTSIVSNANIRVNAGGELGELFRIDEGSTLSVRGGKVDSLLTIRSGGTLDLSAGQIGRSTSTGNLRVDPGGVATISGGILTGLETSPGSMATLVGGDFRVNDVSTADSQVTLLAGDHLSGVLEDGSPFVFSPLVGDAIIEVELFTTTLPQVDQTPFIIEEPGALAPPGLRAGQSLTLLEGGELNEPFSIVGGRLAVAGGAIRGPIRVDDGVVDISSGSISDPSQIFGVEFGVFGDSVVNVTGGNILGGVLLPFTVNSGSEFNIFGGAVSGFRATAGSEINIIGGAVGESAAIAAEAGSEVNLFGSEFYLDGQLIDELRIDEEVTITNRDATLSGLLADGSSFEYILNSSPVAFGDFFDPSATLTVTLVTAIPEPTSAASVLGAALSLAGSCRGKQ